MSMFYGSRDQDDVDDATGGDLIPVKIKLSAKEFSLGIAHGCALDFSNEIYCWGSNKKSQLGVTLDDGADFSSEAVKVVNPEPSDAWKSVVAAGNRTCGVKVSNKIFCWGDNQFGQSNERAILYSDPIEQRIVETPTEVHYYTFVAAETVPNRHSFDLGTGVDLKLVLGNTFSCAYIVDGPSSYWCWGLNAVWIPNELVKTTSGSNDFFVFFNYNYDVSVVDLHLSQFKGKETWTYDKFQRKDILRMSAETHRQMTVATKFVLPTSQRLISLDIANESLCYTIEHTDQQSNVTRQATCKGEVATLSSGLSYDVFILVEAPTQRLHPLYVKSHASISSEYDNKNDPRCDLNISGTQSHYDISCRQFLIYDTSTDPQRKISKTYSQAFFVDTTLNYRRVDGSRKTKTTLIEDSPLPDLWSGRPSQELKTYSTQMWSQDFSSATDYYFSCGLQTNKQIQCQSNSQGPITGDSNQDLFGSGYPGLMSIFNLFLIDSYSIASDQTTPLSSYRGSHSFDNKEIKDFKISHNLLCVLDEGNQIQCRGYNNLGQSAAPVSEFPSVVTGQSYVFIK